MATGVPGSERKGNGGDVELAYPGKLPPHDILSERIVSDFQAVHASGTMNRLYCGDNFSALKLLMNDAAVRGKVSLVYIDPPFATRGVFLSRKQKKAYDDDLRGAEYVESLRRRLLLLRELLSPSGSIYLHLDETMVFQMKLIMDELFGACNYRNTIIRKKCNPKNYTKNAYGNVVDYILFYTKTDRYTWNRPVERLSEQSAQEYRYVEPDSGRRFMKVPVHAPGKRNGSTGGLWRGKLPPPGKHWQYPPDILDQMDARGEISWSKNGNPRRKIYLDEHSGAPVQDVWLDFRDAHNQNIKITGYPTEKNPELLRRIIRASSNPGDLVLDCYAGSGTTMAVADELGRHWIGVDQSPEAVSTIFHRFERGLSPMGDFVNGPSQSKEASAQMSLFDCVDANTSDARSGEPSANSSAAGFSVYIENNGQSELEAVVESWIRRRSVKRGDSLSRVSEGADSEEGCFRSNSQDDHPVDDLKIG